MKTYTYSLSILFVLLLIQLTGFSQKKTESSDTLFKSSTFSGLKFRSLGPAFMSGRIADIAIHPENNSIWYVAVGSGGVWKTKNAGITWNPIFDDQSSYSIGCITIDPNNTHRIWVGTGENVGGRHVGYGDGIYKSDDDGRSWENMGLKESQHISKIIVHPQNPDIIWVAAQGPLWNKGGERGLYKTVDGGLTWKKTLGDDEWVGVTDMVIDSRNPDRIYAATWQRNRNVASYMGGGPGTGIYRSVDAGETWEKLTVGLPTSNMGKIGLAISPQQPDVIYAAIELDRRTGGVYRSENRGASWEKRSEAVSIATGPHYYQELYASPHTFDKIYLMDLRIQVSEDGGKNFTRMKEQFKHSDNHAIAFRDDDPDYLLVGTDGGIYESYDNASNWRYIDNLPVTQYYKLAVDDTKPFYNIYGGTQDNSTQGGPSRTDNRHGILNSDWFMVLSGDGHQPATEPGNPNIVYAESQEGYLFRTDRSTGETVFIKPQPEQGEAYERYNWDSPILISPHSPTRIYFASQRLWRSDDRGDSWEAISGDLTKNQERFELPIMDKKWSWDSPWDVYAMSNYNTITSLAESPLKEGLIYAGTDDGLIQITEDGGLHWRKTEVKNLPGVPATAFINDIKADLYNESIAYIVLDNHKFGDFNPYLLKTTDKGKSWKSIKGNLPERTLLWRIVQDHVKSELMFTATEFGIYFTIDGGEQWVQLKKGMPTISVRDIVIQKDENDLVAASFGRGFFILDDYSPLRQITENDLQRNAILFTPKDALWYIPRPVFSFSPLGSKGASTFVAPNPPFGAVFTYYIKDALKDKNTLRKENERKLIKEGSDISFPGWDALEEEINEKKPYILLSITDDHGNIVRKIKGPSTAGIHRIAWNLKYPALWAIDPDNVNEESDPTGFMVAPGTYSVTLWSVVDGNIVQLDEPVNFDVIPLNNKSFVGSTPEETSAFWRELEDFQGSISALSMSLDKTISKVKAMHVALFRASEYPQDLDSLLNQLRKDLLEMKEQFSGKRTKEQVGEKNNPTIYTRLNVAVSGTRNSTYGPTQTHKRSLEIAKIEFEILKDQLEDIMVNQIPKMEKQLIDAGAPWIEGQPIPNFK